MTPRRKTIAIINEKEISKLIYTIRGKRVMLDRDLAVLYGVSSKRLNEMVKRNLKRFPADFMFRLDFKEFSSLRSQIATSNSRGGRRYLPHVFTENGVAMLSSVLNSERAIQVNIHIMRIFTQARTIIRQSSDIHKQVKVLEHQVAGNKMRIDVAFDALDFILDESSRTKAK